ncbi:MAG TPA: PAS domain S-box protein, partial [Leptospiraceae bacterium]|nr:PAS domain S-box protein [Leptospiraceae bacterium]
MGETNAQFRQILDVSPIPFALNDENQNITYLNRAFTRTFGYDLTDIPTLAEWWPRAYPEPAYRERVMKSWQERMEKATREGTQFEALELTIRCKDGSDRIVIVSAVSPGDAPEGVY